MKPVVDSKFWHGILSAACIYAAIGLVIALCLMFVSGCTTPNNHRLLCNNSNIQIDITAAWLCYPKFNREQS